ncbi:hypothetical protein F4779DRAFT_616038 [Xylariaceae sp. FL0662B]|nr:hypothetical protein F4779DRAFT_616038 [Xylariaceae sp. FL0662B]
MDISPNLVALGIEDLGNLTLKELENKLNNVSPEQIYRPQVLETLMGWLHEQIKEDTIMQQKSLLPDFMNLLTMQNRLPVVPFNESEVGQIFKEWQIKDAVENPANRRRYLIAHSEIQRLFQEDGSGSDQENRRFSLKSPSQSQHEGLSALPNEDFGTGVLADIGNKTSKHTNLAGGKRNKTGANEIPLGKRKSLRGIAEQEAIKFDEYGKSLAVPPVPDTIPTTQKKGLPLRDSDSAGATTIGETDALDVTAESMPQSLEMGKPSASSRKHFHGRKHQSSTGGFDFSRPTPPGYVCKRCGRPGKDTGFSSAQQTWTRNGTNLLRLIIDVSLTKQRQRVSTQPSTPTQDDARSYRDRRSPSPYQRRRSRSPVVHRPHKGHDIYRPDVSPRPQYEDSDRRSRHYVDRTSVSPWSARERMTRELQRRGESPRRHAPDKYRPRGRSASPPRSHRDRTAPTQIRSVLRGDPTEARNREREGRLAYDDDVFMDSDPATLTPEWFESPKQQAIGPAGRSDKVTKYMSSTPDETPEQMEQAKRETSQFLELLGVEILTNESSIDHSLESVVMMDIDDDAMVSDSHMSVDTTTGEEDYCKIAAEEGPPAYLERGGVLFQTVLAPRFSPNVVEMFRGRGNPVIHPKSNRKTAEEIWREVSEKNSLENPCITWDRSSSSSNATAEQVAYSGSQEVRPSQSVFRAVSPSGINLRRLNLEPKRVVR